MPKRWTAEEEAALFQESQKYSVDQLAKKYGVTSKSVAVKLQKLRQAMRKSGVKDVLEIPRQRVSVGGEAKKWSPEEERELFELHQKGWKNEQIASHYGVSIKAVSVKLLKVKKKFAAMGIPSQPAKPSPVPIPVAPKLDKPKPAPILPEPMVKPMPPKPILPTVKPAPIVRQPAPPVRPTPAHGKQVEGETVTQFKVWNGTEWITIKVPKRMIHV